MSACLCAYAQVCQGPECKSKLAQGCSRLLACGHWCGGVAGETECLPCLHVRDPPLCLPLAHLHAPGSCAAAWIYSPHPGQSRPCHPVHLFSACSFLFLSLFSPLPVIVSLLLLPSFCTGYRACHENKSEFADQERLYQHLPANHIKIIQQTCRP